MGWNMTNIKAENDVLTRKLVEQVSEKAFKGMEDASSGTISLQAQHVLWPTLGGLATGAH